MKKRIAIALASVLVYLLLLLGLTTAEGAAGGSIRTLGDALWYSLVTLSTVGYGDLAPITPAGRLIGALFVLLSLGVLAFLLGMALTLLTGRGLPGLRLALARKRRWYVFSERGAAAEALANSLSRAHPDAMIIFCTAQGRGNARVISVAYDVKTLCCSRFFCRGERFILLMAEDEAQNCEQAAALRNVPAAVYCRSEETGSLPDVSFFDPREACARLYWQQHPLLQSEHDVVLLGDGRYAQALLSQAVLVNCMTPWRTAAYHLFGDWAPYMRGTHQPGDGAVQQNHGAGAAQGGHRVPHHPPEGSGWQSDQRFHRPRGTAERGLGHAENAGSDHDSAVFHQPRGGSGAGAHPPCRQCGALLKARR